jgi:citrate synthase
MMLKSTLINVIDPEAETGMTAHWITAEEAQARLGVKLQTLYAYTSRGLISNRTDAQDPRRSLYAAEDINRLTVRKMRGRRASVAHEAMSFGEPVLNSAITTISGGRLYYRGRWPGRDVD